MDFWSLLDDKSGSEEEGASRDSRGSTVGNVARVAVESELLFSFGAAAGDGGVAVALPPPPAALVDTIATQVWRGTCVPAWLRACASL